MNDLTGGFLRTVARLVVWISLRFGLAASSDAVGSRRRVPPGLKSALARMSVFVSTMGGRRTSIVLRAADCTLRVPTADVSLFWSLLADRYEPWTLQLVRQRMRVAAGAFLDVGGNIGVFSVVAALAGKSQIVAFEPDAANAGLLRVNSQMNAVDDRVDVQECAVGASDGTATLYRAPSHGNHSIVAGVVDDPVGTRQVERVSLDSFVARRRRERGAMPVSLVKVDCEGSELAVLRGASELLRERDAVWIVEYWEPSYKSRAADRDEFWSILYSNFSHVFVIEEWSGRLTRISAPPSEGANYYVNLLCTHSEEADWMRSGNAQSPRVG